MSTILDVSALHIDARHKQTFSPVLTGVDLEIHPGQVHGLVGESGAGKSMLAKSILGILPPSATVRQGSIRFADNVELIGLSKKMRRRYASRHIAMIPQNPMTSLNPVQRVGRQMSDVLRLHMGFSRNQATQASLKLLEDVQIRDPERVMRQYPFELSGGMRQRALIAIAFSCKPELVIADEPTTALDVTVQRQILQLIKRLQGEFGTAVLFISHDLGVVAKVCDFVSVIADGEIVERQKVSPLFNQPRHSYTQKLLKATAHYYHFNSKTQGRKARGIS